ncbi:zinc-finger homeodomain protein 5-like [Gastrolobium bilobum]|uniref:zinc-finger homeodomain protein 5-like n=1 Tax=Gastrolobium bilobum TaxID=150636 RepID=UPI002AB037F5|nr:zinc-finger homeodomain protein 5-like [Gastrolobium bilobum]
MEGGSENYNCAYKECLRNHAASLGSYATDGCGEFTVEEMSAGSLQCAACGCHRNFHRKVKYPAVTTGGRGVMNYSNNREMMEYEGGDEGMMRGVHQQVESDDKNGKKRFRSKFTTDQKEKMLAFAEKIGWKLQRKDLDDEIERFCRGIGVSRQVFKVWMHNHKNSSSSSSASTGNISSLTQ